MLKILTYIGNTTHTEPADFTKIMYMLFKEMCISLRNNNQIQNGVLKWEKVLCVWGRILFKVDTNEYHHKWEG